MRKERFVFMLEFWQGIFYSAIADPIFAKVASILGVTKQVCKEYCTSGMMTYGGKYFLIVLVVIALLFVLKLLGFLNPGNYGGSATKKTANSPLAGKKLIFLGSSVTKGFAARGRSFVDMIAESTGASCVKEAVSGTTLVDNGERSYVARLKKLDKSQPCDLFICQLSTNDATKGSPLGKMAEGKEFSSFDTKTVCGAIEYIIAYAKQTWNDVPVVFYTSPEYASPAYQAMVEALAGIAKKWGVEVIDFWHDREINMPVNKKRSCMNDQIHPTQKGYAVWAPVIEAALAAVAQGKSIPARPAGSAASAPELAKRKTSRLVKSVLCWVLVAVVAFGAVIGGSTYNQLVVVKGLKNAGNSAEHNPENLTMDPNSPIKGKKLFWLGSSVFQGFGTGENMSPAVIFDALTGTESTVEVKGGTTLAAASYSLNGVEADVSGSYYPRLSTHDTTTDPQVDLVLVQLSTNDSKGQTTVGEVSASKNLEDFDIETTIGSLEAIIAYADKTWGARTMVIGGSQFVDEMTYSGGQKATIYLEMIDKCHQLEEKWGEQFVFVDLWNTPEMYENIEMGDAQWRAYMSDAIHPTKWGYAEWWGPHIIEALYRQLG